MDVKSSPKFCGSSDSAEDNEEDDSSSSSSSSRLSLISVKGTDLKSEPNTELSEERRDRLRQELCRMRALRLDKSGENAPASCGSPNGSRNADVSRLFSAEDYAKLFFETGCKFERNGMMHNAIRCYKKALQLVPNIEQIISKSDSILHREKLKDKEPAPANAADATAARPHQVYSNNQLTEVCSVRLPVVNGKTMLCTPENPTSSVHISALPPEVLVHIFKWVISDQLDVRQLEQLSMVCCGFYLCARTPELWHAICSKIWGCSPGDWYSPFASWRELFLFRPHVLFNGLYISKVTYIRQGDTSYQDYANKPWHVVTYYRCLRFFTDGTILMLTTSGSQRAARADLLLQCPKSASVMRGSYKFSGYDALTAVLCREKRSSSFENAAILPRVKRFSLLDSEQSFIMELQIANTKRHNNVVLKWKDYEVRVLYRSGQRMTSKFHLSEDRFPNFYFFDVKRYANYSEKRLP